jgi:hypothetical protein
MDVVGPPSVVVVPPRVGTRPHRHEAVPAVVVGEAATGPGEVGVERRVVLVDLVSVAARGVGLPDLHELTGERLPVAAEHPTAYDDPLAEGLARVLPREIVVELADVGLAVDRSRQLSERLGQRDDRSRVPT